MTSRKYLDVHKLKASIERQRQSGVTPHLDVKTLLKAGASVPTAVSLEKWLYKPFNQESIGSCAQNANCLIIEMMSDPNNSWRPSRLYLYTKALLKENPGQPIADNGSNALDGATISCTTGVCTESLFPYTVDPSTGIPVNFGQIPGQNCDDDAKNHVFPSCKDVTNNGDMITTIRTCLSQGYPVNLSAILYPSFEGQGPAATGLVPTPTAVEMQGPPAGGHSTVIYGVDATYVYLQNSWDVTWGFNGKYALTHDYFTTKSPTLGNLAMQLVIIDQVFGFNSSSPLPAPTPFPAMNNNPNPPSPPSPPINPPGPAPPQPTPNPPGPSPSPSPTPNNLDTTALIQQLVSISQAAYTCIQALEQYSAIQRNQQNR